MSQVYKQNFDMEEEEEQFEDVLNSGFKLYKELHDQLYDYQRSGLVFLYKAYEQGKKGVILADEMGLGKSIQVITFLSGMMDTEQIKNVLLVMPVTLKKDWADKLTKWTPGIKWQFYHHTEENPTRNLRNVQMGGDVLLTSYRMLVHKQTSLSLCKNKVFTWDCVIYDEAHELKNHTTKTFMAATVIPAKFKILLTGMPVQSNLRELWALFSIVAPAGLLGSYNNYKKLYKDPITRATEAYASPRERASGKEMLWRLQKKIEPYFLRRTKDKIFDSENSYRLVQLNSKEIPHLPKKTELVVWIRLSPKQETMYRKLIFSRGPLNEACYSLQDLHTLKSICNHPRQLEGNDLYHLPIDILLAESGKLTFLVSLLKRLLKDGHRILVFSQFLKMLDIIQHVLEKKKLGPFLRIDGTTHLQKRERQYELFQENSCYRILLFTTKVGAIGLTLTSASRVVIVDPSWNQEVDSQAVNQAYRIGQKEKVVVYRLITCGTVEEKMYRKQVFKSAIWNNKNPFSHFTKDDLRDLLPLGETRFSVTQRLLDTDCLRPHQSMDEDLKFHETFLRTLNVCSISDYKCPSSTKQVEDLMEEIATMPFRVKSDVEKNVAAGKIQKKTMRWVRASLGQIDTKKVLKKRANHRKSGVLHGRKYAISPYTTNRQRLLLKLFHDLENGSYERSDRQSMDSNNTDCRTNTENINTVINTCRLGSKKKGYTTTSNSVIVYNLSYIPSDSISDTSDNMACNRAVELKYTHDLETEDADETAFDFETVLTPLIESKANENRQPPSFTVSSSPYLKSNVMDHLVGQHPCSPKVALNSPEHPSQCSSKLQDAIRGLCDYSLTPSNMSPSCLLSEHEYSDQGGSSSRLRKQSKEQEIEVNSGVCGSAAISKGVPFGDVSRKRSTLKKSTGRRKPGLPQKYMYFTSPYDADKWTGLIGSTPVFSDLENESFDLAESEESQAEDGNNAETKRITQSIDAPSDPQTNTEMASVSPVQTNFSFESPMPAQKRSKNSRMPPIRCSQITFSPKTISEKIDKDEQQSQPRLILGELQHKDLKQNCSSTSPLLMDHPSSAPTPVDTGYLENFHQSKLSTHIIGQSTSSASMLGHTSCPKTSISVPERKIICSGLANADHPNGQYIESRINSSQSRLGDLATDGRLIEVLENLLQILKK